MRIVHSRAAILHIDGDSFFASCEVAKNPALRGKRSITGKERGIVSACTYEAKARGVKRGVRLSDALKACPDAIVFALGLRDVFAVLKSYVRDRAALHARG